MRYQQLAKRPSTRFYVALGFLPGYDVDPWARVDLNEVGARWNTAAAEAAKVFGVFPPSAVISDGLAVYSAEAEGAREPVVTITGTLNPYWGDDPEAWQAAVLDTVQRVADSLGQVTVQVNFEDVEVRYYRAKGAVPHPPEPAPDLGTLR